MFGEDDIVRLHEERANLILVIIIFSMMLILLRLAYLQLYKGDVLLQYSLENRLREEVIYAPRGVIYGRSGEILVDNNPRFDAILTRQYVKNKEETLKRLSQILVIPKETIQRIIQKNSFQAAYRPIVIKKNISMVEVAMIETENENLPGVSVDVFISREYLDEEVGSHVLGYISEITQDQINLYKMRDQSNYKLGDFIGQFGLEKEYDKVLRGVNGREYVEVDAHGRKRKYINTDNLFKGVEDIPSVPGNNLVLTLDRDMQLAAYQGFKDKAGSLVAMDVENGEIYAMVSAPAFQPSGFTRGIDKDYWESLVNNTQRPLRDRVIQEHYSPGSTFKPFTAMALLDQKVYEPKTEISCTGGLTLGNKTYHCWKKGGHGSVNLLRAIRESCNSYFQKASLKLDIDDIAKFAKMFGMGSRTGIELPRETSGLIPTKDWKMKRNGREWQKGETLSCAIGQSYVLATPLQMAVAYAGIANQGKILRPHLVKEIKNNKGQLLRSSSVELLSQAVVPESFLEIIRQGLYEVVNSPTGTAFYHRGSGLEMAGKTGTSQVIGASADKVYQKCEEMPYDKRHHGL
nr:penicillin-binding protein 2 [Bacteriovoracaceae bacterium]